MRVWYVRDIKHDGTVTGVCLSQTSVPFLKHEEKVVARGQQKYLQDITKNRQNIYIKKKWMKMYMADCWQHHGNSL